MEEADWRRLGELREAFLARSEEAAADALPDYWRDDRSLHVYERFLAARIGWKWDAVLEEARGRGLLPAGARVLDWGCGTGIAARRWLARCGAGSIAVHDRSPRAMEHAAEHLRAAGAEVARWDGSDPQVLLLSHVLDELDAAGQQEVLALARRAQLVLVVEAGSRAASRALSTLRDALQPAMVPLAPCPHRGACGVLAEGAERHWCHHFASVPEWIHRDAEWAEASRRLRIDLRALPVAWVLMARAEAAPAAAPVHARLLARPRAQKGLVRFWACEEAGVAELELLERRDKAAARALGRGRLGPRLRLEHADGRVQSIGELPEEA